MLGIYVCYVLLIASFSNTNAVLSLPVYSPGPEAPRLMAYFFSSLWLKVLTIINFRKRAVPV